MLTVVVYHIDLIIDTSTRLTTQEVPHPAIVHLHPSSRSSILTATYDISRVDNSQLSALRYLSLRSVAECSWRLDWHFLNSIPLHTWLPTQGFQIPRFVKLSSICTIRFRISFPSPYSSGSFDLLASSLSFFNSTIYFSVSLSSLRLLLSSRVLPGGSFLACVLFLPCFLPPFAR
jgi:hypothetical protein